MKTSATKTYTPRNGSGQILLRCAGCGGALPEIRCLGVYVRVTGGKFIYGLCDGCATELDQQPETVAERAEARIEEMLA